MGKVHDGTAAFICDGRGRSPAKVEVIIKIKRARKIDWYADMVGNMMKCYIYRDHRFAESLSLGKNYIINDGDFKILKGRDIRPMKRRD